MISDDHSIVIRQFTPADAEACFKIRSEAFVREFYKEVGPEVVAAGVNAFMPDDYRQMAETTHCFVAEDSDGPVGFCTLKIINRATAEILFLYVKLDRVKEGIGTSLARYAERWLADKYPAVSDLTLDTIIPRYNKAFYEKLGFLPEEEVTYEYPGKKVRAVRLTKKLAP
jgi:GNAT superfamily N-acetyltransferase